MARDYYQVIVTNGDDVIDEAGRRIAPDIKQSCGHRHRTREAAERCRVRLADAGVEHGQRRYWTAWACAQVVQLTAKGLYPCRGAICV